MSATDVSPPTDRLAKYPQLRAAAEKANETRKELDGILSHAVGEYTSEDASLVVFGSLARDEWTSGSDLDWTYLIDGQADPAHLLITQRIQSVIEEQKDEHNNPKFKPPGQTGTFGNIAFSHELLHQIGGQHDTNRNMTQRILLLLESKAIGKRTDAYERVLKAVINRYLEEDNHLLTPDGNSYRVPRFLLNDIVRFWRTMAVDFASKQRDRGGKGWGTRNAKLRMSRKLIFAAGLLICFGCQLDTELRSRIRTDNDGIKLALVNHLRENVSLTPLQVLVKAMRLYDVPDKITDDLLSSYADFLAMLDSSSEREALDKLRAEDSRSDKLFDRVRSMSERFEHALDNVFFENKSIEPLTRKYGVF
ncbi:MAG TPA: nucleotidyltransferase domain-containing protein [Terriglobales bacterium]|jgi:predicted nucleotidyltransferase|nr:nucleotidyltransferase domain-containing protein [Terriglobales bacterium]